MPLFYADALANLEKPPRHGMLILVQAAGPGQTHGPPASQKQIEACHIEPGFSALIQNAAGRIR